MAGAVARTTRAGPSHAAATDVLISRSVGMFVSCVTWLDHGLPLRWRSRARSCALVLPSPAQATAPGRNGIFAGIGETAGGWPAIFSFNSNGYVARRLAKWYWPPEGLWYSPNVPARSTRTFRCTTGS